MSASNASAGAAGRLPVPIRVAAWMLLASVSFAILLAVARHLADGGLEVLVISFWRNLFAALLFVPWAMRVGARRLVSRRLPLHAARATFLVASSTAMFFAAVLMPIAEVTAISFTTPLFATLLAVLFLKERLTPARLVGLLVGFGGVLVMLRPGLAAFDPAALLVIFSALSFGGVIVLGRMLAATDSSELMVALLALFSVPLAFVPALFVWEWPEPTGYLWLIGMAVVGNFNMYGIVRALKLAEASLTQPYDFLRLPATAAVGYLAFGELPDAWTWTGAAIICAGVVWVTRAEARRK